MQHARPCRHLLPTTLALLTLATSTFADARHYGGRYTADRLHNAQANCEKYDWARKLRDQAVAAAAPWLKMSDDDLWSAVPGQDLPRTIDVTLDRNAPGGASRLGCLQCGAKIFTFGNYPYDPDFKNKPWKLTCPSCGAVFPTNDFAKYYASGIDDRGLFNPKKADRSLLYNADHPDPNDPLHTFGVDDGFGFIDQNGRGHRFIAYYAWKYWNHLQYGLTDLADAYVYTGDPRYAHKAAVLLDRIADVYPDMDWKPYFDRGFYHSDGGTPLGKIEGRIWETGDARRLADAYDKILSGTLNDDALFSFLKQKSEKYETPLPKGTRDLFVANVDERLLREIHRGVLAGQISGNEGMHQAVMTTAAIALDTQPETTQWLDWLFEPTGGAIPGLIVSRFDRDGLSPEGAPNYALLWGSTLADAATRLADYPKYTHHDIFKDFPQFTAAFTAGWNLAALGAATPNIGDTGATGLVTRDHATAQFIATGYRYTHDPSLAIAAYRANHNSATGLAPDLLSPDPDSLSHEIESLGKQAGPRPVHSYLLSGFGLATLESSPTPAKPTPQSSALTSQSSAIALCLNYGRTIFHAHPDHLNFDLLAFGHWLTPDLGYPEFATSWPSRNDWNNNTLSHNTVTVDGQRQSEDYGGHTRLFTSLPGLSAVEISAPNAYPHKTSEYSRTMATIDTPDGHTYVLDIFKVAGGSDHLFSLHGPPGPATVVPPASPFRRPARGASPSPSTQPTPPLTLTPQPTGTYAGPTVPFASPTKGFPAGYQYLYNVQRASTPPASFTLDWHADPNYRALKLRDVHLRFHSFTPNCTDLALADGDPAQNKVGNPRRLTYALLHRTGTTNLSTTFVSLLEPYRATPFIQSARRLPTNSDAQIALEIHLPNNTTDTLLFNADPTTPLKLEDGTTFTGHLALLRRTNNQPTKAILLQSTSLTSGDLHLHTTPSLTGHVVKMNKNLSGGGLIWTDADLPTDGSLTNHYLTIQNDNERDACYPIHSISKDGPLTRIDCGPISFVRGYAGPTIHVRAQTLPKSYDQGYLYDFNEGAPFTIPTHLIWEKPN